MQVNPGYRLAVAWPEKPADIRSGLTAFLSNLVRHTPPLATSGIQPLTTGWLPRQPPPPGLPLPNRSRCGAHQLTPIISASLKRNGSIARRISNYGRLWSAWSPTGLIGALLGFGLSMLGPQQHGVLKDKSADE